MILNIDPKETIGGITLASARERGAGYHSPKIIVGTRQSPDDDSPPRYTVADMQDGFPFFTGTREEVIEWISQQPRLQLVPKMFFKGPIGQLPENRAQLPIIAIAYSGADGAKH